MMPQLLEQKNFQQELKPLLVRAVTSHSRGDRDGCSQRQLMLDMQSLVAADPTYRQA
jgi:hypothetical protein